MYNASQEYWDKIKERDRVFELKVRIEHEEGTLELTDADVEMGSFKVMNSTQAGEEFTIGGTVAQHLEFTIVNKDKFKGINFIGAKLIPTVKLLVVEPVDAHFIQASQPSKMVGFDGEWEHIPVGQFNIDVADRLRSTIDIKAVDNMILLDKSYNLSKITFPTTLERILQDACSIAGVGTPQKGFVNDDYVVQQRPEGELSLRNIVGFVAELAGSYAKFDRTGRLYMGWYEDTDITITKHQRMELKQSDYEVQITGVSFEPDEKNEDDKKTVYMVGTDDYMIDISDNLLLQDKYDVVLPKILRRIESTKFVPFAASWRGNPAIDVGDILTHIDLDGNEYRVVATNNEYVYRGVSTMAGKALPSISRGFQSKDNRIANIIGRIEGDIESGISNLEQEQLRATELIGNMLGGYVTKVTAADEELYDMYGDGLFVHDTPDLSNSMKIWKWGIGGFGFSDDGGKTYKTGITMDSSIVAELISAKHINTGTLSSNKGTAWINLDTGEFELGGMKLIGNDFSLSLGDIDLNGNMLSDRLTSIIASVDGVSTTVTKINKDYITSSQLNIKAGSIESTVKSYTDTKVSGATSTANSYTNSKVSSSETSIMQTVNSINTTVNTISRDYATTSQITQLSGQITSRVSKDDFTGYKVASMISQSSSAINLIANKITLTADNIDLDGITRVNSSLRVGSYGQKGTITLSDRSYIQTTGTSGNTVTISSVENHLTSNQLHLKTPNIHYNSGVSVYNSPYMSISDTDSSNYTLDYSSQWNQLIVRKKGSADILGRITLNK